MTYGCVPAYYRPTHWRLRPARRLGQARRDGALKGITTMTGEPGPPPAQGLYDPRHEHDACGVGFVVNIKGVRSHSIVRQALQVLINLLHRGACGCEVNTGDGAGILVQMPDRFLRKHAGALGVDLPAPGEYGAGLVFLPRDPGQRAAVERLFEQVVTAEGQRVLGWRDVPTDDRLLGATAVAVEPVLRQIFIGRGPTLAGLPDASARFERKLYVIRKRVENAVDPLEFLVMTGRSLPHAILMMIPEPWQNHESMDPERRAFYEYHASLMEPWDGPASIAFTDGTVIGAVLDRNGLRPSRYYVTKDDLVIMASEVGVLDIPPERILIKERLHPGRIFLVDTAQGRIIDDEEIKRQVASQHPYADWLRQNLVSIEELPPAPYLPEPDHETVVQRQQAFGYTHEDLRILLAPMARMGEEPVGSMGTDTALAVLSNRPRLLYDYFKQLFAQVTNPPLDAIREELVTSMESTIGPERNLLKPEPESCRQITIRYPLIDNDELAKLVHVEARGFRSITLPMLYDAAGGGAALERAMDDLRRRASAAIAAGHNILILSDRGVAAGRAPIPSLLATAGVHHHLVREGSRTKCALVVESGDAREVHHMALLIGYGAGAVNPYLAFETLDDMISTGLLPGIDHKTAVKNYIKALNKGILKVMPKMGLSTLQSYCSAQIFEAIGLDRDVVDRYFTWTASRIGGVGVDLLAEEVRRRHARAFPDRPVLEADLDWGGEYQWRRDGEYHLFNPDTVFKLQHATRSGQYRIFKDYTKLVDDQNRRLCTLRGLMELKPAGPPVPLDEVEPVEAILKRVATGAMSYGSISQEAHETLAIAMNRIGGKSNTGEGGEDPARYRRDPNGDWRRSAIKQVASARFGVTSEYLVNADDLQIKMAQGAKPGERGPLPGTKVYPWIARVRYATPGVGLISPPPHHDIYSIEDLAQLIHDLKNANPSARIHVKLVAVAGVGTVAAGVAKAHADVVLICGHDGGTGASPLTSLNHGGVPWELGLAETQQVLRLNGLRDRIVVPGDGQMKTGRDGRLGPL